ncbi:PREDICTED: mediator of RNA polymerase II transcription subunit 1-like [Amphimedon queenslandica]|uniref:Mediator of RNA polymerase II transcription subunit 1 n=1 Tax=Amphimedon queenslandica TaxID=400682 RepID=A0A1X7VVA2_AMPQE|nr:PREDICTED: mediator of RNA polymerase II transcription subunit 1-like [Amphimedon queenslandica]|eukprot:XP_019848967.1 PREDICTED: mediator of RNA polymerase II transcription subunit 1-like [Amphimedon queenslandica]
MSDESRIRELSELIRNKCLQTRQQQQQAEGQAPNTAIQVQGAEVLSRLREVIVRLQEEIKDPSPAGIQQRLQYTASKLGLNYSNQRSANGVSCYLNTESFYVEVCVSDNGTVTSANVVLGQETQKNTDILVKLLQDCKYIEFEKHIKSLVDMFSQATGQDTAVLLLKAVFAIESILSSIENPNYSNPIDSILLNHLGIVTPRKAGLPMKLTFFITPSEGISAGLNQESSSSIIEGELDVGISAKVQVERSSTQFYRLPIDPNIFNSSQGAFAQLTEQNSVSVPLTLILSLNEDIPICTGIAEKLQQTVYLTTQTLPSLIAPHVDQLIISEASKKVKDSNVAKEHITNSVHTIYLPGQVHEYVGLGVHNEVPNLQRGVLLPNRSVPFTHPVHVIKIIYLLRQQLVYNTLLVSCLTRKRRGTVPATKSLDDYSFHVSTQPPEAIIMATQLLTTKGGVIPLKFKFVIPQEKVAPTQPVLHLQAGSDDQSMEQSPSLNKILAKSLSIPVTIHAGFSRPGVLPPSVAAAFKDHQDALKAFNSELTSCGIASGDFSSHMTSLSEQQLTGVAAGFKRKRPPV